MQRRAGQGRPAVRKPMHFIPATGLPLPMIGAMFGGAVNVVTLAPVASVTVFRYAAQCAAV